MHGLRTLARYKALPAVAAALLVLCWQALTVHYNYGGNWTALFMTGTVRPAPAELKDSTYVFPHNGYDGQWYRYLAHDLWLTKGYWRNVDAPVLRFRRVLVPAVAWIIALGNDRWIDGAFIFVVLLSIAIGVYWTSAYLEWQGVHPAWGLLFLFLPATLASIDRMLVDATLTALFAGFMYYSGRDRFTPAWFVAAAAALTRDSGVILVAALAGSELLRRNFSRTLISLTAVVPMAAWYLYLGSRVPVSSPSVGLWMERPVIGLFTRVFQVRDFHAPPVLQAVLRFIDVAAILGLLVTIGYALVWCWRKGPSATSLAVAAFAAMGLAFTNSDYLAEAFGFARPVSPMILFVAATALERRRYLPLAACAAMSLAVAEAFASQAWRVARAIF